MKYLLNKILYLMCNVINYKHFGKYSGVEGGDYLDFTNNRITFTFVGIFALFALYTTEFTSWHLHVLAFHKHVFMKLGGLYRNC